jgi:hypothetical protein
MSKDRHTIFRFAATGFGIAVIFVILQVVADYLPPGAALSNLLFAICVILCPPSLLMIPLIDVETGTGGFYIIWVVLALLNAGLYAGVGTAYVGMRQKRSGEATS